MDHGGEKLGMVKKKSKTQKLTPEQKAFIVGRQYQARIDALAIGKAVETGRLKLTKKTKW